MKKIIGAAALAMLFVLPAAAETVVMRGNSSVPPKAWVDQGTAKGFAVDMGKAALEAAGYTVDVQLESFKGAMDKAQSQGGVVTGVFKTKEREDAFLFTSDIAMDEVFVVVRKGKEFPLDVAGDLKGKRVGHQEGAAFGQEFADARATFTSVTDSDPAERLKRLHAGEVDAAVFNPGFGAVSLAAQKAGLNVRDFTVLPTPIALLPNYMIVAKDQPGAAELVANLNVAIAKLKADGTAQKIMAKYAE